MRTAGDQLEGWTVTPRAESIVHNVQKRANALLRIGLTSEALAKRNPERARASQLVSLAAAAASMLTTFGGGDSGPPRAVVQRKVPWKGVHVEEAMINFIPNAAEPVASVKIVPVKDKGSPLSPKAQLKQLCN